MESHGRLGSQGRVTLGRRSLRSTGRPLAGRIQSSSLCLIAVALARLMLVMGASRKLVYSAWPVLAPLVKIPADTLSLGG